MVYKRQLLFRYRTEARNAMKRVNIIESCNIDLHVKRCLAFMQSGQHRILGQVMQAAEEASTCTHDVVASMYICLQQSGLRRMVMHLRCINHCCPQAPARKQCSEFCGRSSTTHLSL